MCDYCVQHGYGRKWYLSARNYAKDLAGSDFVKAFCESFFGQDVQPGSRSKTKLSVPTEEERKAVDERYRKFLHHQVISTEEAISVLQLAESQTENDERTVVQVPCICRYRVYGSDPNLRCFGIAFTSEYTRRFPKFCGGGYKYISTDEAIELLEKMVTEEPIVHAASALGVPYLGMLCNCDMQVCSPYLHRLRLGIKSPFYKAHHRAIINYQKCTGCSTCEQVCPFNVAKVNPSTNVAEIDPSACYGCGVCIQRCPENAITLIEVDSSIGY